MFRAEIDTSVSPTDNLNPWVTYGSTGSGTPLGLAIDIASGGALTGGRIELLATDRGAGVRHADAALAMAGDLVVSSTGDRDASIWISSSTLSTRAGRNFCCVGQRSISIAFRSFLPQACQPARCDQLHVAVRRMINTCCWPRSTKPPAASRN